MSQRNKKILLIILIIIIVSTALLVSQFGNVSAGDALKPAGGESPAADISGQVSPLNESVYWSLAKLLAALMVVVAGIYGFLYILRRMMGNKLSGNRNQQIIEVLETTYVAQKKSVSLIRYADRAVLVGVADTGINILAELDVEQTAKILSEYATEKPLTGFAGVMNDAKIKLAGLNIGKLKSARLDSDKKRPQTA